MRLVTWQCLIISISLICIPCLGSSDVKVIPNDKAGPYSIGITVVTMHDGRALPGSNVTVFNASGGFIISGRTGNHGSVIFTIPANNQLKITAYYKGRISYSGFSSPRYPFPSPIIINMYSTL